MEKMPELPEDVYKSFIENIKYSNQIDYSSILKNLNDNFSIIKRSIENMPLQEYSNEISKILNEKFSHILINKQKYITVDYFDSISKIYPDLYITNSGKDRTLKISDNRDGKNQISIANTKDAIMLNKMIDNLSFTDCSEFINHLSIYPMLGYQNRI